MAAVTHANLVLADTWPANSRLTRMMQGLKLGAVSPTQSIGKEDERKQEQRGKATGIRSDPTFPQTPTQRQQFLTRMFLAKNYRKVFFFPFSSSMSKRQLYLQITGHCRGVFWLRPQFTALHPNIHSHICSQFYFLNQLKSATLSGVVISY